MKCVIIVDIVHLYYIMIFSVVKFEVNVVFVIGVFFVVSFYNIEIDFYNCEFFVFFLDVRYVYIFILKFFDSSIFKFSFNSIFDIFIDIDIKAFPKSIENRICFVIIILYFIFIMLIFF